MLHRLIFLPILLTASTVLLAQHRQGTITYERKTDVRRHMEDEQMKAMLPPLLISRYTLLYRDSLSVYKSIPKDDAPDPFDNPGSGGLQINMKFSGPGDDGELFRNFSSGLLLQQTTLADVEYVITDTIASLPWKLSPDTLTILGHLCKKATAITPRNKIPIIAWYCEDIPLPIGPDNFGSLPGAILMIDQENGFSTFTAVQISPAVDTKSLKTPSGKMITRPAFEKKMDEIDGPADSLGRRMIRRP